MSRLLGFSGLKKLAQRIEPKKWNLIFKPEQGVFEIYSATSPEDKKVVVSWMGFCGLEDAKNVSQLIAAADRETVIKMAERIEIQASEIVRLEHMIATLKAGRENVSHPYPPTIPMAYLYEVKIGNDWFEKITAAPPLQTDETRNVQPLYTANALTQTK